MGRPARRNDGNDEIDEGYSDEDEEELDNLREPLFPVAIRQTDRYNNFVN